MMERLDRFMARANAAYYATRDPFTDFTTAPELSQAFGEILGLWAVVVWQSMGSPTPVILAELGPGRGTLMADALRAIGKAAPELCAALRLHLVETSPRLRAAQAEKLMDATWHDGMGEIPPGPMILLANEFLDALPIRQFVRRGAGWMERFVEHGTFVEQPAAMLARCADEGEVVEICDAACDIAVALATRLAAWGGAALLIDYGPAKSAPGDSLQALRAGKPADPLADPGGADLTAHVDFAAIGAVAGQAGAATHGPIPQGKFLTALGLLGRSQALARGQSPSRAATIMQAAQRLTEPDRMGLLFKALAITHPALPTPPGFEA